MGKFQDLTGLKFGRLTVIERAETKKRHIHWRCKCECGQECTVAGYALKSGNSSSCGCLQKEKAAAAHFQDLSGMVFGMLTPVAVVGKDIHGNTLWECQCKCGNITTVSSNALQRGNTKSCGCLKSQRLTTHGLSDSAVYQAFYDMKSRCLNPANKRYADYGGRGIKICDRWLKFENFYEDVSKLEHFGKKGYSLDRINNDGNYEPDNVRWADRKTQQRNRRNNILIEYQGTLMTVAEASAKSGVAFDTLKNRIERGESGEYLFRLPTIKNRK